MKIMIIVYLFINFRKRGRIKDDTKKDNNIGINNNEIKIFQGLIQKKSTTFDQYLRFTPKCERKSLRQVETLLKVISQSINCLKEC